MLLIFAALHVEWIDETPVTGKGNVPDLSTGVLLRYGQKNMLSDQYIIQSRRIGKGIVATIHAFQFRQSGQRAQI